MYPIYFQHTYQTLPELENRQWSQRDNIAPAAKRGSNIVARKTVPCEICQKLFFSNFGLRAHKRDLHGIIEDSASNKDCDGGDREASFFSCDSCNKRFKTMNALQSHERDAHRIFDGGDNYEKGISESIQMLPCDLCNRLFKTNFGLLAHRRDSHHEKLQNSIPGDENNTAFPCSICRRVLKTSIGLLAHQRDAHDMEPLPQYCVEGGGGGEATGDEIVKDSVKQTKIFNCAYCRKAFRTFLDLRAHERDAHGLVNEASPQLNTPSKMIPCTICQKVFWTIFGLYTHQRDAHSIAPREISVDPRQQIECTHCDCIFTSNSDLLYHIESVHGRKERIKCDFCNRRFSIPFAVEQHMQAKHASQIVEKANKSIEESETATELQDLDQTLAPVTKEEL